MSNFEYEGKELELFQYATVWKAYWKKYLQPYIKGDVLEVGAGIGFTTKVFSDLNFANWYCLEPDINLLTQLEINLKGIKKNYKNIHGTLENLDPALKFDCILYIDVIEHIEGHEEEMIKAFDRLKPDGFLLILVPAYNWLFSEFDEAIGHYRRYNKSELKEIIPKELKKINLFYLDSIGVILSSLNKMILKEKSPTKSQILLWDRVIVRLSKLFDKFFFNQFGKSLIGVWQK